MIRLLESVVRVVAPTTKNGRQSLLEWYLRWLDHQHQLTKWRLLFSNLWHQSPKWSLQTPVASVVSLSIKPLVRCLLLSNCRYQSSEWSLRTQECWNWSQSVVIDHWTIITSHQSGVFSHQTDDTSHWSGVFRHRICDLATKWGRETYYVFLENILPNFQR